MASITTRAGKGSPLTNAEVDANFVNLNTDKLEATTTATLTNKTINIANNTLTGVQPTLVSGTSIKTVNSASLLGSGDILLQAPLVSGTSIKTVNSESLLGSGDISLQTPLVSGTSIKTVNSASLLGSGDISLQTPLVSGTSIKTINSQSLLGSGNIAVVTSPGGSTTQVQFNDAGVFAGSSAFTFSGTSIAVNGVLFGKGTGASNANSTAVGVSALIANTTGADNTAMGFSALRRNTTGSFNTAFGMQALDNNQTGEQNTAVGNLALFSSGSGIKNTAIGYQSLFSNTGSENTAVGRFALYGNTSGTLNTAVGTDSLSSNTTGLRNTALGYAAMALNTTGRNNTAVGDSALFNNTTGEGNTAISPRGPGGSYSPVFNPTTESNRFCMGATTVTNAYIQVAWTVVSDARDKTDFAPVSHGLDFVSKLKPTAYRYKMTRESEDGHGPLRYGFKAQDVLELEGSNPVIVDAEDPEKLRFNDQSMIAVLVKAIQELKQQFDDYKASHP